MSAKKTALRRKAELESFRHDSRQGRKWLFDWRNDMRRKGATFAPAPLKYWESLWVYGPDLLPTVDARVKR